MAWEISQGALRPQIKQVNVTKPGPMSAPARLAVLAAPAHGLHQLAAQSDRAPGWCITRTAESECLLAG